MRTDKKSIQNYLLNIGGVLSLAFAALFIYDYYWLVQSYGNLNYFTSQPIGGDFINFWSAGWLTAQGQALGAYMPDVFTETMGRIVRVNEGVFVPPFFYPPSILLFLAPLGLLPYFPALLIFYITSLILLLLSIQLWTRDWRITSLALLFFQVPYNLLAGQNGLFTAALFGMAMYAVARQKPVAAGGALGLLSIKPQLGILIPFALMAGRQWKTVASAGAAVLALVVLTSIVFGVESWIVGIAAMLNASTVLGRMKDLLQVIPSLFGFLRTSGLDVWLHAEVFSGALTPAGIAMTMQLLLSALVTGVIVWLWRTCENPRLRTAGLACGILLFTPFIYAYDFTLLLWPLLLLGMEAGRTRWSWAEMIVLPLVMIWPFLFSIRSSLPFPADFMPPGFVLPLLLLMFVIYRARGERRGVFARLRDPHPLAP